MRWGGFFGVVGGGWGSMGTVEGGGGCVMGVGGWFTGGWLCWRRLWWCGGGSGGGSGGGRNKVCGSLVSGFVEEGRSRGWYVRGVVGSLGSFWVFLGCFWEFLRCFWVCLRGAVRGDGGSTGYFRKAKGVGRRAGVPRSLWDGGGVGTWWRLTLAIPARW